jgi:hypothetical protein
VQDSGNTWFRGHHSYLKGLYWQSRKEGAMTTKQKVAIACQGGGSHTAFTAGVLKKING